MLIDNFHFVNDLNHYVTRNTNNLHVPKPNIDMFRQSFAYTGPSLYNSIPKEIMESDSLCKFKKGLKSFMLSNAP